MTLEDRLVALAGRLGAVLGLEDDWAAMFGQKINAPLALNAGSKTAAGLLQLASTADVVAGTDDQKVLTSKLLAAAQASQQRVFRVTSLPALVALGDAWAAAGRDNGELVSIVGAPLTTGQINYGLYFWYSGKFFPVGVVYLGAGAEMNDYQVAVTSYSTRMTAAVGARVNTSSNLMWELLANGFMQINSTSSDWSYATGMAVWDSSAPYFVTEFRRMPGGFIHCELSVKQTSGAAFSGQQTLLNLGPSLRPSNNPSNGRQVTVNGYGSSGWAQGAVALAITPGGTLATNAPQSGVTGLFGEFVYPAKGV